MSKPTVDTKVVETIKEIQANKETRWVVMGYEKMGSDRIVVVEKGTGGIDEVQEEMNDGKVLFAYIRYDISGISRYAYIGWCGDGVQGMRKGNYTAHAKEVESVCKPCHTSIHARNEKDIDDANIKKLLTKAMGANYDAGAKQQGTKDTGGTKKEEVKAINNFVTAKDESAAYWAEEKKKEQERKIADEERVKQEQARLIEAQKQEAANISAKWDSMKPVNAQSSVAAPKTSNAPPPRTQPQQQQQQQQQPQAASRTPVAAPPPRQSAPVPVPVPEPEPEPIPEPEPEQYQQQQEEQYQEQEQQQQEQYQEQEQQQNYQEETQPEPEPEQSYDDQQQQYTQVETGQAESDGSVTFTALYDYDAQEEGELSFKAGETIWVLNQDAGGWWTGQREDYTTGLFPGNYVGPKQ